MSLSEYRKEGIFYFAIQQIAGDVPGGDVEISVFAAVQEGESALVLLRTLYFDEQSQEHIDNFCTKFAYDDQYRKLCLAREAHWCRVARLYIANVHVIIDEPTLVRNVLAKRCRELFHLIRRDLVLIESRPEYQEEMARVSRGEEDMLDEVFSLLARVNLKVSSACQGSALLQFNGREIYLPSCHSQKAHVTLGNFPECLKSYLRSGPLGQQHLALFEETGISAVHACHNRKFIGTLTASLQAFSGKNILERTAIKLPEPLFDGTVSVEAALLARTSIRSYKGENLTIAEVSQILWAAQGSNRKNGMRTIPSAGGLYPLEVYLIVGQVEQVPAGIYKYRIQRHELVRISGEEKRQSLVEACYGQSCIEKGSVNIVIAAVYQRTESRYGERAARYVHMEAGHVAQNIYLQAVALELGTVAVGAFDDSKVKKILLMDAEEFPLYIMPVGHIRY